MYYQDDFFTPGMLPSRASSRKQMRQRLKSRIKPRGRPHLKQRRTVREENFGVRFAFTIIDFFAIKNGCLLSLGGLEAVHPAFQPGLSSHPVWSVPSRSLWLPRLARNRPLRGSRILAYERAEVNTGRKETAATRYRDGLYYTFLESEVPILRGRHDRCTPTNRNKSSTSAGLRRRYLFRSRRPSADRLYWPGADLHV